MPENRENPASWLHRALLFTCFSLLFCCGILEISSDSLSAFSLFAIVAIGFWSQFGTDEVRLTRCLMVSFCSGLKLMSVVGSVGISELSDRHRHHVRSIRHSALIPDQSILPLPTSPPLMRLLSMTEVMLLSVISLYALGEYAMIQARLDERDRDELFNRLGLFFDRYQQVRGDQNTDNERRSSRSGNDEFRAFTGRVFKTDGSTDNPN